MKAARVAAILSVLFVLLIGNLFTMQVLRHSYYRSLSEKNRIRVIYLEGPRGKILDRKGRALTSNRLSFNCSVIPAEAKSTIHESLAVLGPLLSEDPEALEARYQKKRSGDFNAAVIAEDISLPQAMAVEEKLDTLPGVLIETRPRREYPLGEKAAHVTGFIGPMNEEESEELEERGYRASDWIGRDGVEKVYESYLRGRSGGIQMEVNNRGRFVRTLGVQEPKDGRDVQLTVDAELQSFIDGLLGSDKGAVVVMDLNDGGVLALNSQPSFDPNLFASSRGRKGVGRYLHHPLSPMINRAIRGQYPAGSVFKIITAFAAFERNDHLRSAVYDCPGWTMVGGKRFRCWKIDGHGSQALTQAFAHSCNVYFYSMGMAAGVEAIHKKAVAFGLSKMTGVDLPGEKPGFVPSREWKEKEVAAPWYEGETANLSIGQGYLQMTPIQGLGVISAVATGGHILKPHLIDKIDGVRVAERRAASVSMPADDLRAVRAGLDAVVNSDTGSGRLARVEGLRISGKTGTAQSGQDKTHAWFIGYAPIDKPRVAMVVFLENGGIGGVAAATLASRVFHKLKELSYV